jgi:hypothetical protein
MISVMSPSNWKKPLQASLILIALISISFSAAAQSGRRSGKANVPNNSPAETKAGEAQPGGTKPRQPERLQLTVGTEGPSTMGNAPYYLSDTVLENCLARLAEANEVVASSVGRHITRGDAIKMAKEETKRYVVLLQITDGLAGSSPQTRSGASELYVTYMIYEPGTAKVKQSGRAHKSIYPSGNVGVSGPARQAPVYSDYSIKQAARETAEKILEAFDIKFSEGRLR